MASHFQAAPLVASPSYPNSVMWSEENLIAVASGHLITILNPASLMSPRGLITLSPNKPFPVGLVETEDLHTACLMPTSLSRDVRPRARSISWSHPGFAPNSGCLLAVCTTGGRVKVYRPPFCEFCAEWVEVLDVSDMLFDYLESINFGELEEHLNADCITERGYVIHSGHPLSSKLHKFRKTKVLTGSIGEGAICSPGELPRGADSVHEDILQDRNAELAASVEYSIIRCCNEAPRNQCSAEQDFSMKRSSRRSDRRPTGRNNEALPRITAGKYVSRSAFVSSVVVAWSPVFQPSDKCPINCSSQNCSILAVGGKSGNISFWRFHEPECYTIEHGRVSIDAMLIGLLQAHKSWISAISWELYDTKFSASQLILATGSSDGSVRIWLGDVEALMKSSKATEVPFSLLMEVAAATSVPVSVISLVLPVKSLDKIVLAVGKGSGAVEVWMCCISGAKLQSAGVYNAHDQVVTGLTWTFGAGCLYSCSQDNSVRNWVLNENHLHEVPFPSNFAGLKHSTNHLQISDPCFGLAISPGESMIAVVRSFDADLLNQMYQARRQKAAVEFFWIGGQSLAVSSDKHLDSVEAFSGFSERDLVCWESNILRSLMRYENVENLLFLWDILAALLAFKKIAPTFVENILLKWISSWFSDVHQNGSIENVLFHVQSMLPKISSRKIHLLNIICRRLVLIDLKVDVHDGKENASNGLDDDREAQRNLWERLLINCEKELRERIVAFTLKAALKHASSSASDFSIGANGFLDGVAQMERWISINSELVHDQLKLLGLQIKEVRDRIQDFVEEESCSFCGASVPFESPEYACCKGITCDVGFGGSHKLARCAVSMKLCSIISPVWYCICCQRWVATLVPQTYFTMSGSPLSVDYGNNAAPWEQQSRPFCPFCGILLQRLLPDFLLSASPV